MRLTKLWTIPVTALLLIACSSETLTDSTTTPTDYGAVSFARLNVSLPTVPSTRAYTPDAGADDEFKVTGSPRIFLFQGTSEAQGTSEDSYTFLYEAEPTTWLQQFDATASGTEYQGSESFIVKLVGANKVYHDLYALVVLNGDNIPAPTADQTFGSYNAAISLDKGTNTDHYLGGTATGFVMANAANAANADASADPTVLVPLTLYSSPDAAEKGPGNSIYVERSAVKVTVRSDNTSYKLKSDNAVTVEPLAWTLTNTNLTMYPFHKVSGLRTGDTSYKGIWTSSRFLGTDLGGFRRTQWAVDPNYSKDLKTKDACAAEFHVVTAADDVTAAFSTPDATDPTKVVYHPLYCAENTFDIAHMMKGQTTAVIVKAQITHTSGDVAANEDAVAAKPRIATRATTPTNVFGVQGHVRSEGYLAKMVAEEASTIFGTDVSANNVDLSSLLGQEKDTLTAANFKGITKEEKAFTPTAAQLKDLNIEIGPITGYEGGICYYIAYIRHFDNDETPWKSGDDTYGTGDEANKKSLGRYGVVRNNWYDLTIQDFAYPGSPKIPTPNPEDPDDDNSVILLNVKVNPWAKETTKFVPLE